MQPKKAEASLRGGRTSGEALLRFANAVTGFKIAGDAVFEHCRGQRVVERGDNLRSLRPLTVRASERKLIIYRI